jgi:hypothetical protein
MKTSVRTTRIFTLAAAALGLTLLSGCVTPTPYAPADASRSEPRGYSETKIEANRYRLKFSGNSSTPRETVENYMLYRAAELTLAQGYDWFSIVERKTDEDKQTTTTYRDPFMPYGRLSWRYYRSGLGVYGGGWGPWGPWSSYGATVETYEFSRYEATAEIFMYKGDKPAADANAFDARSIKANLEPKILRPVSK